MRKLAWHSLAPKGAPLPSENRGKREGLGQNYGAVSNSVHIEGSADAWILQEFIPILGRKLHPKTGIGNKMLLPEAQGILPKH